MACRILRPALSPRYRVLREPSKRCLARKTTPPTETAPRSFYQFSRGTWVFFAAVFTTGATAGALLRRNVVKPRYPDPDSPQDKLLIAQLNERIDNEFKVSVLRGKCLGVAKQLKGQEGGWVELVRGDDSQPSTNTLRKSLAGAKGLGVERLFWNRSTETLVAIIWFGPSMSGWPNVTHGGVIASQFMEKISLAVALARGVGSSVSQSAVPQRLPGTGDHAKMLLPSDIREEPRELSLSYVKPTMTENFYVLRVSPAVSLDVDPSYVVPPEPQSGTHDLEATLEAMDARILVKAKAKYKQSSVKDLIERSIDTTTQWTYDHFREWMWPSRQGSFQR